MLKQLQKRKSEGFTIIEVLIVLAIAGLIMVVVFLAVPAIQRSGRNNALSTDANNILTSVGNYATNNGGTLPTSIAYTAGGTSVTIGATGTSQETAKVDTGVNSVAINPSTPLTSSTVTSATPGTIQIITGSTAVCNGTENGLSGTGSPRSYALLYVAESGSGPVLRCIGA